MKGDERGGEVKVHRVGRREEPVDVASVLAVVAVHQIHRLALLEEEVEGGVDVGGDAVDVLVKGGQRRPVDGRPGKVELAGQVVEEGGGVDQRDGVVVRDKGRRQTGGAVRDLRRRHRHQVTAAHDVAAERGRVDLAKVDQTVVEGDLDGAEAGADFVAIQLHLVKMQLDVLRRRNHHLVGEGSVEEVKGVWVSFGER